MTNIFKLFGHKGAGDQRQKADAEPSRLEANPSAQNLPSQLLQGVLNNAAPPNKPVADGKNAGSPSSNSSKKLNIGIVLSRRKATVIQAAERLEAVVDAETSDSINARTALLRQMAYRIAVVGQMNAGKSSLINVIVDQAGLLPADINPWTTVITNLHFGVPDKPISGASFSFFTTDEWARLSAGGRVRELTQRTFPEFDWATLNEQVDAMRARAEKKLGSRFQSLLGASHDFPELTPGLLNHYVGAGPTDLSDAPSSGDGEFSDITKLANVYFDLGPFNFPAIVTDTPGVNDPTLVRDEVTRQSVESADVCVVVLTARQLLSNADLSLLRMLKGLNKNRFIIFVNKIDEIQEGQLDAEHVSNSISAALKQEVLGSATPIVLGSALWAMAAKMRTALPETQPPKIATADENSSSGRTGIPWQAAEIIDIINAEALMLRSGIPNLALAISELMQQGVIADTIDETGKFLEAVSAKSHAFASLAVNILEKAKENFAEAQHDLVSLRALENALLEVFAKAERQIATQCAEQTNVLREKLLISLRDYTEAQIARIGVGQNFAQINELDLLIRMKLESVFLEVFEQSVQAIIAEKDTLNSEIEACLDSSGFRDMLPTANTGWISHTELPSMAALSEPACIGLTADALDLSTPLQVKDAESFLATVIYADFDPIVDMLVTEASRALISKASSTSQEASVLTLRPLHTTTEGISAVFEDIQTEGMFAPEDYVGKHELLDNAIQLRQAEIATLNEITLSLKSSAAEAATTTQLSPA